MVVPRVNVAIPFLSIWTREINFGQPDYASASRLAGLLHLFATCMHGYFFSAFFSFIVSFVPLCSSDLGLFCRSGLVSSFFVSLLSTLPLRLLFSPLPFIRNNYLYTLTLTLPSSLNYLSLSFFLL